MEFKVGDFVRRIGPSVGNVIQGSVYQVSCTHGTGYLKLIETDNATYYSERFCLATQVLTDWFPMGQNPWEPGVYQVWNDCHETEYYSYWNGESWSAGFLEINSPSDWKTVHRYQRPENRTKWRGVKYI